MKNESLGDRQKRYERAFLHVLPQRMPFIIRVDGKAFHTLLRDSQKPWDLSFEYAMDHTAQKLCEEIQGAQLAYVQSDEISVLVHPYKRLNSQPWFAGDLQKIVSVSASAATAAFNRVFGLGFAMFDSRAFVLPEADVCNYFLWRQQDAARNSVQMLGRTYFSQKELHGKSCNEIQEMLMTKHNINWNDVPTRHKRGRCALQKPDKYGIIFGFSIDDEIPMFSQDRDYINKHLAVEEE